MVPWILSLLLTLAPPDRGDALPAVADAIDVAVAFGPLPFDGPAAREASAIALAVIAEHEGDHFDPRVASCARTADGGQTVSLFGLMRGASWYGAAREDLCAGGPLPAYLALRTLTGYARRCAGGPLAWWQGYASGSCAVRSDAARAMCFRWERLARRAGIAAASCWTRERLEMR